MFRHARSALGQAACGIAISAAATLLASTVAVAAPPAQILSPDECDPIIIPQPAKKVAPVKKPAPVRKAAQSAPATPLPKAQTPPPAAKPVLAAAKPAPKPKPKPKPKAVQVAAKPIIISDACPSAGSDKQDLDSLPTNLANLVEPGAGAALPMVFPEPAAGSTPFSAGDRLSSVAPRTRNTTPGNTGPTVPLTPGGGGSGGGGGGGDDDTPPEDTPPPTDTPPSDTPPGDTPPGDTPPPPDIPPPVKVPEPGTIGVMLGGLAGMALLRRRRSR